MCSVRSWFEPISVDLRANLYLLLATVEKFRHLRNKAHWQKLCAICYDITEALISAASLLRMEFGGRVASSVEAYAVLTIQQGIPPSQGMTVNCQLALMF